MLLNVILILQYIYVTENNCTILCYFHFVCLYVYKITTDSSFGRRRGLELNTNMSNALWVQYTKYVN